MTEHTFIVRAQPHHVLRSDTITVPEPAATSKADLHQLAESISHIGLLNPLIVDSSRQLVDGRKRLAALTSLGVTGIPVITNEAVTGNETYTPVQAAAVRRCLREQAKKSPQSRTGVPLSERRKKWASELATAETGISRTTMDRVDKIVRVAEDTELPLAVRRQAAEGLTRIDSDGVAVDRVLKEVELAASAAAAVNRYPELRGLPDAAARTSMASQLDALPDTARAARIQALHQLLSHSGDVLTAYQLLKDAPKRIEHVFELGNDAASAITTLRSNGQLPPELLEEWHTVADRLSTLTATLRTALNANEKDIS